MMEIEGFLMVVALLSSLRHTIPDTVYANTWLIFG